MTHRASARFWKAYEGLAAEVRDSADKQFKLLKSNPRHPSLQFKKVGKVWSARVNSNIRALAAEDGGVYVWFWIGDHHAYENLIQRFRKR